MRLLYATSIRFPSPLANRIQILAMASAFHSVLKDDFVLGISENKNNQEISSKYFEVGKFTSSLILAYIYLKYSWNNNFGYIFCREEKLLFFMIIYQALLFWKPRIKFIFEIHDLQNRNKLWYKFILKKSHKIISITKGMEEILVGMGVSRDKVFVSPDAVDISKFNIDLSQSEARIKVGLPQDKKIILYTGSLEAWKGVSVLYEASKKFNNEYLFVVVGGRDTWVEEFKGWYPETSNFKLLGYKDHSLMPIYQKSADVLVLPNSAKSEISNISTSPMKLFEYMASGVPIVASRLPSIIEVLNDSLAVLVDPDNVSSLSEGIKVIINNPNNSALLGKESILKVMNFTWDERVRNVITFIS